MSLLCDRSICAAELGLLPPGARRALRKPSLVATTCIPLHRHAGRSGEAPGHDFGRLTQRPVLHAAPILQSVLGTIIHTGLEVERALSSASLDPSRTAFCRPAAARSRALRCGALHLAIIRADIGFLYPAAPECGSRATASSRAVGSDEGARRSVFCQSS